MRASTVPRHNNPLHPSSTGSQRQQEIIHDTALRLRDSLNIKELNTNKLEARWDNYQGVLVDFLTFVHFVARLSESLSQYEQLARSRLGLAHFCPR